MSIEAVNWAFSQRGLKPATKLVLVFLADCHNRHTKRCDPSQELLASECGMSRSTVNVHLGHLEKDGLIRRIQRSNLQTKKKKSTLYLLGCDEENSNDSDAPEGEDSETKTGQAVSGNRTRKRVKAVSGKTAKPCPENGQSRVRTSGHKPERNLKRTGRAKNKPAYFTADEEFEAKQIAKFINDGGSIVSSAVKGRIRECISDRELLTNEQITDNGLNVLSDGFAEKRKV